MNLHLGSLCWNMEQKAKSTYCSFNPNGGDMLKDA